MFENIFGSGEEKERLEKLESELEEKEKEINRLERKLEKENERAREAITEKQKTDKELKEAKHKIESLEDRINKLEKEKSEEEIYKEVDFLFRSDLILLLDELESFLSQENSLITHYFENLKDSGKNEIVRALKGVNSQTGFVHLKDQFKIINLVMIPPLPVEDEFYRDKKFQLDKIRKTLESDYKIGFISAHFGKSAVGLLRGNEFAKLNIVETQVKSKHSKGGYSQGRFERNRKEQVQTHLKKILERIEEFLASIDYLILDGNNRMVSELKGQLNTVPVIEKSLDIGNVSRKDKEDYIEKIWGSRIYIL
ncbi:hypothetical protein AKJ51_01880 [candidate division MSBL1 archaeon SCGC-AAA382A20]|uniref:Actinobacteria/chloroflexi VLRF1 release factor domain-containing protein n=1 Tax=candidate division MSBL1 archaeon SCGC-AAA382A20 TaxID=1698280 RepID=A0A133VL40_9EURY|nr:hypothetical protein AKJ51_01880 [candidate division MSBL1 archaeon SCGC-AAA382A20]